MKQSLLSMFEEPSQKNGESVASHTKTRSLPPLLHHIYSTTSPRKNEAHEKALSRMHRQPTRKSLRASPFSQGGTLTRLPQYSYDHMYANSANVLLRGSAP